MKISRFRAAFFGVVLKDNELRIGMVFSARSVLEKNVSYLQGRGLYP
jgi:hypothetical protein